MIKVLLIKFLKKFNLIIFTKKLLFLTNKFVKLLFIIPGFILLIILKINYLNSRQKIYGLRLTRRYFGHLAIESALASSFQESNNDIKIISSFKRGKGIKNLKLNELHAQSFKLKNDFYLILLNIIYYNSLETIKKLIKQYYEPFIDKNNLERELRYLDYLETSLEFPWRKNSKEIIFKNKKSRNIIIAMRTEFYSKGNLNYLNQPWRNISLEDLEFILKVVNEVAEDEKIYCYTNKKVWNEVTKFILNLEKITFVDEEKKDILEIINENSILINNGNGIGAAVYALGLKTLYLHHTTWHFWSTSHTNAFTFPCIFKKGEKTSFYAKDIIKLAFSPKVIIPYNFEKDFYSQNIFHNSISEINMQTLKDALLEVFRYENSKNKFKASFMGIEYTYKNRKEKYFWELFIQNYPKQLRRFKKIITLNISDEFLKLMN